MKYSTRTQARSITRASSTQTYLTAILLADRDLSDDCLRAYAYLRWVDDVVDISTTTRQERVGFIERQKMLVEKSL